MAISDSLLVYRFPPEILILIFSTFSWDGSEPFIPAGKDCAWFQRIRALKALLRVSRFCYNIAAPMLYSLVYLRHTEHLEMLVRTLDKSISASNGASSWVEQIQCEVFVPLGSEGVYRRNIAQLIAHCRCIRKLVHAPIFDEQLANPLALALLRILPPDDPFPNLLELKIGEHVLTSGPVLRVPLSGFTRLKKLHLKVDNGVFEPVTQSSITLPDLETLICDISAEQAYNNVVGAIPGYWSFPKLRNLSVRVLDTDLAGSASLSPVEALCTAYGAHLSYLCIHVRWAGSITESLSGIYNLCPNLNHISYSYPKMPLLTSGECTSALSEPTQIHSSLRRVSFESQYYSTPGLEVNLEEHILELTQRSLFPSLDTIVVMDPRLHGDVVDGRLLPGRYAKILQDWSARSQELGIRFLNYEYKPVNVVLPPEIMEVDDESDSEYETDSEASDSESDQSDSGADESDDVQIGRYRIVTLVNPV